MYAAAYFVVTSISTITLYVAYNIPVFLNVRNKLMKKGTFTTKENAPWNLKGWGPLLNVIAVVYTIFICIVLLLPPNELVLWTMVGFVVILVVYWFAWARKNFTGPEGGGGSGSAPHRGRVRCCGQGRRLAIAERQGPARS